MKEVLKVKSIFEEIKSTTKTTIKQEIIEKNKDNELFLYALHFLCNPFITTGLHKGKISKRLDGKAQTKDFKEALDYIKSHNTGRDEDIAYVIGYIESQDIELTNFLRDMFTKSYSIGIGASGINKVIPNFIPRFEVMLAESYDKNKDKVQGKKYIITLKLDGMRIICIVELVGSEKVVKFYSRQGQVIEGLVELEEEFKSLPTGVYDGELLADGKFSSSKVLFQETMKRARLKGEKTGLRMYCFDYIADVSDFSIYGKDDTKCIDRKNMLSNILNSHDGLVKYLKPLYMGDDIDMIDKGMKYAMSTKQEGLMVNIADAPYECKRTKNLLKVKVFNTVDLRVIGYEEGQGEFVGTLGALLVDYKGYTVKVGSGFTQDYRKELWNNIEDVVGKIVEIKYFEESQNQNGGLSLRFPVFLRVRDDKSEPGLY